MIIVFPQFCFQFRWFLLCRLWRLKPAPTAPPAAAMYVGSYAKGDAVVTLSDDGTALLLKLYGGAALNLTAVDSHADADVMAFRTHPVASTAGCRWLDDGQDQEIAYFDVKGGSVARLRYMNGAYERDP